MTSEQTAGLERLADGLRTSAKPGPVLKDIADAFRTNANNTATEFKVIRDALADLRPRRARPTRHARTSRQPD